MSERPTRDTARTGGRRRRSDRVRRCLSAVLVASGVLVATALTLSTAQGTAGASATDPFTWSPPAQIADQAPFSRSWNLTAISCPTASFCAAADDGGDILTSTDPSGGATAWTLAPLPAIGPDGLVGISCPTASLCVAVNGYGDVTTSTDPLGGSAAWTTVSLGTQVRLAAVSCPATTLCVAAAGDQLYWSTDPTGGPASWTGVTVGTGAVGAVFAVSCPTTSFCAATGHGYVDTSADPTGDAGAWAVTDVAGATEAQFSAISCPSPALCVASGSASVGNFSSSFEASSADPGGGSSAWSVVDLDRSAAQQIYPLASVSCPDTTLCVIGAYGGELASTDPTGDETAWSTVTVDDAAMVGLSCPDTDLCVAVGQGDQLLTTTDPSSTTATWASVAVDGTDDLSSVSCPSATLCAAVDTAGHVVTSTDPTAGPSSWTLVTVPDFSSATAISCPTTTLCVAVDARGFLTTSTDPTGGPDAWTVTVPPAYASPLSGISCPTTSLCVAVGDESVMTSTDPTGGPDTWTLTSLGVDTLTAISCPGADECVATNALGSIFVSTDPSGGAATWLGRDIDSWTPLSGISCPAVDFCAVTDEGGDVLTSSDPTAGPGTWTSSPVDPGEPTNGLPQLTGISCPATTQCSAVADTGTVFTSTDPTGGAASWSSTLVDDVGTPTAISCPSTALCAVVDGKGDSVVGLVEPSVTSLSPSTGTTAGGTVVTVSGRALSDVTSVTFGGVAGQVVSCSAAACTAVAPPGPAGPVPVVVTSPEGSSPTTDGTADTYTYATPAAPAPFHPLTPTRICDTRVGTTSAGCPGATTLGPGGTLTVSAAGNGGVPSTGATTVVANVTATDTTASSYLTAYPGGQSPPSTSVLNWSSGQTVADLVTVALSPTGTFDLSNYAGSTDVVVDVEGYFGPGAAGAGLYHALGTPARICDTRAGNPSGLAGTALSQCEGRAPGPGESLSIAVAGLGGVPDTGVGAVVLNVTAVDPSGAGYLTVSPAGSPIQLASDLNYTAGQVVPNQVVVPVGQDDGVEITSSSGTPAVVVDVAGWFTDGSDATATGAEFVPSPAPVRLCDTRNGIPPTTACTDHTLGAGATLGVTVAGDGGIPADATAVVGTVTVTDTTSSGYLTVSPAGQAVPLVSTLNWTARQTVPNAVTATVGTGGRIDLTNPQGSVDVIVDVVGWFD